VANSETVQRGHEQDCRGTGLPPPGSDEYTGDSHHGQGVEQIGAGTLPRARSCPPLRVAMIDEASSGRSAHRDKCQADD
jgi:hypothetical protein